MAESNNNTNVKEREEAYLCHVEDSQISKLRGELFGHNDSIVIFKEGILAKKSKEQEVNFYQRFNNRCINGIIPNFRGVFDLEKTVEDGYILKYRGTYEGNDSSYVILDDILSGYMKPAVLDIKLGKRTWEVGAGKEKVLRHKEKCSRATTAEKGFRIRAAFWYSDDSKSWKSCEMDKAVSVVDRNYGKSCSVDDMLSFFNDFFKYKDQIPVIIDKLRYICDFVESIRRDQGLRMYSSSVLVVYDELNPEKFDCRLLDFEKTYFNVGFEACPMSESLEDLEDHVVFSIKSLINVFKSLKDQT